MARSGIVAALLATFVSRLPAESATRAECKAACPTYVAACRTNDCDGIAARKQRRCAKRCFERTIRKCRKTGVDACTLPYTPDAPASPYYTGIDLGTLGGRESTAKGLNERGDVVGYSMIDGVATRAFVYSGGMMKALGTLGRGDSYGFAINESGHVAGWASEPTGVLGVTLALFRDDTVTNLGFLAALPCSVAIGEDDRVLSCFGAMPAVPFPTDVFFYTAGGINTAGIMAVTVSYYPDGPSGFFRTNAARVTPEGAVTHLGTLADPAFVTAYSTATAINDAGDVVGASHTSTYAVHAFLYTNGTMSDLGTLHGTPGESTTATAVNDAGQILGSATSRPTPDTAQTEPFLYQHGTMRPLGALLDPALGWTLIFAAGINDRGQIAATAFTGGPQPHAVLLKPPVSGRGRTSATRSMAAATQPGQSPTRP